MREFGWDHWFDEYDETQPPPDLDGDAAIGERTPRSVIVGVATGVMLLAMIVVCVAFMKGGG